LTYLYPHAKQVPLLCFLVLLKVACPSPDYLCGFKRLKKPDNSNGEKMKRTLLSMVFCTTLIAAVGVQTPASAMAAFVTASTTTEQQTGETPFADKQLGIQLLVPAGWEIEKGKEGTLTVSKADGNKFVVAAITTLPPEATQLSPQAQLKAFSQGVFSNAKREFKGLKLSEPAKGTLNGTTTLSQSFDAKSDGDDVAGFLILLSTDKPVIIYIYGSAKLPDTFDKEVDKMIKSFKKIE
jgi:hypothetical protein